MKLPNNLLLARLASLVDSMSQFKNDSSPRGRRIYESDRFKASKVIAELRDSGVDERHPHFNASIVKFNYWR